MLKGESAKIAIEALNPDVKVNVHPIRVNKDNVLDLIADYDVIVDGADNFPTRYLLNDAALMARKPLVHASILRFEGHASVFLPVRGALLPLPLPGAAAAGHGALVRRGRRAGRALRRDGEHPGERGDQGAARTSATRSPGAC